MAPVSVISKQAAGYDYWSFINTPIKTHSGLDIKLKDFAGINSEITNNTISREDQQYVLTVGYDFIGNYELGKIILDRNLKETAGLLPLGYTDKSGAYRFSWDQQKENYWLIFLIVLIIYFICSVLLESFRQPFVVISLIPFSLIVIVINKLSSKISIIISRF